MTFFSRSVLAAVLVLCGISTAWPTIITWDGGGGTLSWQTPANWSGDILPGLGDDVFINIGGGVTVTSSASVTIRSLQCTNNLALSAGTFRVTGGDSVVQGRVSVSGNPILSASGGSTTFTLLGTTNVDGAGLEALSGARLSLPSLAGYNKGIPCIEVTWQAVGTNSVLEASSLASVTGGTCVNLIVQATSGGTLLMTNLTSVTEGMLSVLADGTNSFVDLRGLLQSPGTQRVVSFEARNRGTIFTPQFVGGRNATITLKPTGLLTLAQLRELSGFTVIGTNADFSALTNLTAGNVTVNSNAVVTATNLVNHEHPAGCSATTWLVTGAGSVLNFSQLTNLTGPGCGYLEVRATAGGTMLLTNVLTVTEGTLTFSADGSNSVVNLFGLQQCRASARDVFFEVANLGAIAMPQFRGGANASVSLASGGVIVLSELRELAGFTVTGMNVTFPTLTNLTYGDVTVSGGANVSVPSLVSHNHPTACLSSSWLVTGSSSILDLSHLTALTGATCGTLTLSAKAGGGMIVNGLPTVTDGTTVFLADGTNSAMDLSALSQIAGLRTTTFSVANTGTIQAPLLTGNTNVLVTLQSGGVFPAAQMRRLLGFTVTGMPVIFSALTNLGNGNVTVNAGGTATAPNLEQHFDSTVCAGNTWLATGAGSVLDFSNLTNLTGAACGFLNINATAGGHVLLGSLSLISDGTVAFLSDGTNSLLDLGALTQSLAAIRTVSFEARNAGAISIPIMQGGETMAVTIKSGGTLDTSQLRLLKTLNVSGTSLNLPGITNLFSGDLTVDQGAVLSLPNLFNHNQSGTCVANTWSVNGAGSVLELSSMTNIAGSTCGSLTINALAGGLLNLSNLVTITDGTIAFLADGTNSRVDLSRVQSSLASARVVSFESRNAASISMPQLSGGTTVAVIIKTNGFMTTAQFERLNNIIVLGTNVAFSSLTNIDGGSFSVSNNATLTAPSLITYAKGSTCIPATWIASGTGSVLNLSALKQLTGGACLPLDVRATNGGQVVLASVTNIPSGTVYLSASGTGGLINVSSMVNFLNASAASRLTATNGGTFLLNRPSVLSGVAINLAAGTPGYPLVNLPPANLVLQGIPWHSYQVDERDTTSPLNPWQLLRRVPLTNDFQIIGPLAAVNTEFRAAEFVADPYYFDLIVQPNARVLPILYAPTNHVLVVQTTTNLVTGPWEIYATVTMTNTFRIFPSETAPQRFFKTEPQ